MGECAMQVFAGNQCRLAEEWEDWGYGGGRRGTQRWVVGGVDVLFWLPPLLCEAGLRGSVEEEMKVGE